MQYKVPFIKMLMQLAAMQYLAEMSKNKLWCLN